MFNVIRKCAKCSKPCAYTLEICNSCGAQLPHETTRSDNIFLGFIYGLRASSFPLKISVRHQTEDTLVFDDLLALSTCHLNAIPTDVYISDLRFLLRYRLCVCCAHVSKHILHTRLYTMPTHISVHLYTNL